MRMNSIDLTIKARAMCSEVQAKTFDQLIKNGFKVMKFMAMPDYSKVAINFAHGSTSGWLTQDGTFHRPIKGKKHVYISRETLERVWR